MHDVTLTFKIGKVDCSYRNGKPIHDLLFDGNGNFTPSITISKILTVQMCMTLTSNFTMGEAQT